MSRQDRLESQDDHEEASSSPSATEDTLETRIDQLKRAISEAQDVFRTALSNIDDLSESLRRTLEDLVSRKDPTEVVIAILGVTGSGKSTLFNSVLGEHGVLPQGSSGQACTAAPVEIRGSRDSKYIYDVEVSFISGDEFREDIVAAQTALKSPSEYKEHTMSQVSKVMAVFPDMSKDDLKNTPRDELLNKHHVKKLLGKKRVFMTDDKMECRNFVRKHVVATKQSKQKVTIWPLVQVAQIYISSPFFRHNIVLADVPGSGDSNKARNARTSTYVQGSAATCVVTPASRGGSDSALSSMIRDSLQDIHFGGRYDKVILVSTKSDAVSTEELEEDLDDDDRAASREKISDMNAEIEKVRESVVDLRSRYDDAQAWEVAYTRDLARWKKLDTALSKGRSVNAPLERKGNSDKFHKREANPRPVKHKAVKARVVQLKEEIALAVKKCEKRRVRYETQAALLASLREKRDVAQREIDESLVTDRNASLRELQLDMYIEEIKGIDSEIREAAEGDPDHPTGLVILDRDYDLIRATLPVCCTTARSFQLIEGLTSAKPENDICKTVDDTGIPQLKTFIMSVGESATEEQLGTAHNHSLEALNDLSIIVTTGLEPRDINPEEAKHMIRGLENSLGEFTNDFRAMFKPLPAAVIDKYVAEFTNNIGIIKEAAARHVRKEMRRWTENPTKADGLYSSEYKATLKRGGDWRGSRKSISFNDRLRLAIQKAAKPYTDRIFVDKQAGIKSTIDLCFGELVTLCDEFHAQARPQMVAAGVPPQILLELDKQAKLRKSRLYNMAIRYKSMLGSIHAESPVERTDDVRAALLAGYSHAHKATKDDYEQCGTLLQAMSLTLQDYVRGPKLLSKPIRQWEKRLNDQIVRAMDDLQGQLKSFVKSWEHTYKEALLRREGKIDLSNDPGKDLVRHKIIATRLIADEKLGLVKRIKKEEEDEDRMIVDQTSKAVDKDTGRGQGFQETSDNENDRTSSEETDSDTNME